MSRGYCIFMTGLSGSGKSAISTALARRIKRPVSVLDGDLMRSLLSPDLGFTREDRETNIRRIGFVAQQVVWCGGAVICACIAPYDSTRKEVRAMIEREGGGFYLVHVDASLAVCEGRDPKGLYVAARNGQVQNFTGVSHPYESPTDAEITIHASMSPERAAGLILDFVKRSGKTSE